MNRILLMVLRNLWRVPGAYLKLVHYGKNIHCYSEQETYSHQVLDQKGCRPVSVQLHFLKPIGPEEYKDMKSTDLAALVKERIEEAIRLHS